MPGIRLVLTQSTYILQRLLDWQDASQGLEIVADADDRIRPEISGLRGPWARIAFTDLGVASPHAVREGPAYRTADQFDITGPDRAPLLMHRATALLSEQRVDEARQLLEEARDLAPAWEAVHFELGKLFLRTDDTERAAAEFAEAARLMPTFAAAQSNLGAALGEMDRTEDALAALEQALRHDPNGFPIVNNIGAVHREAGRLTEAEAAFRRVIELAPSFVFGHYNLGHTLFLEGRFDEARSAYEDGYDRDSQKNARQGCRLAVARAAAGDAPGAIAQFDAIGGAVPADVMRELAGEAERTIEALRAVSPSAVPTAAAAGLERVLDVVRRYTA
jgi:tetratricopeptide (TPR) repeat protein